MVVIRSWVKFVYDFKFWLVNTLIIIERINKFIDITYIWHIANVFGDSNKYGIFIFIIYETI